MEKKFCSHHQGSTPANGGSYVWRGRVRRWICFACQAKNKERHAPA